MQWLEKLPNLTFLFYSIAGIAQMVRQIFRVLKVRVIESHLFINISSVVELQRWWVLKSKLIGRDSTYSMEFLFKRSSDELQFVKKCQNCTFKVNFRCQKSINVFQKKCLSTNINLGDRISVKPFFSKFNF